MDGGVVLAPVMHRSKDQIDHEGNKVKPFSKEIIVPVEKPYVPTAEELAANAAAAKRPPGKPSDALTPVPEGQTPEQSTQPMPESTQPKPPKAPTGLALQIKAMVNQAVQEALAGIDIKGIVAEAIKEAFKDISL